MKNVSIGIAYFSVFIDVLGLSMMMVILPFLALYYNANSAQIGLMFASYAGCQMISIPISGRLSDYFGRRPLLLASLLGSCFGFLVQGLSTNFGILVFGRALAGLFGGSIPIAQSVVADLIPIAQRPKYYAILGIVLCMALMFGPGIGAGLAQFSLRTPFFVSSGLALFGLLMCCIYFQETLVKKISEQEETENCSSPTAETTITASKEEEHYQKLCIRYILTASFFSVFSFAAYMYFSALYLYARFGWKTLEYGFMAMAFASMSVFIQGGLYPYLIKYFGKHGLIILGSCCMVIGNLSFAAVRSRQKFRAMPLLIISLFFLCFGFSILSPSITAVLSRYAPADRQGAILGTSQGLQALSRVLGPLLFGGLFGINAASCYIVASFFALVSALFAAFALNTSIKFKSNITHHLEEQQQEHISQPTYLSQQQQILLENQRLRTRLAKFEQRESPLSSSSSKAHFVDLELASNSGDSKVPRKSNNACIPLTLSPDDDNVPIELTPSIRNSRPPPCLPSLRYDDDDDQQSWFSEIHLNTLRHLVRGTPHPVF